MKTIIKLIFVTVDVGGNQELECVEIGDRIIFPDKIKKIGNDFLILINNEIIRGKIVSEVLV